MNWPILTWSGLFGEALDALRENGFIVSVKSKNTNFISGMIATAAAYVGKDIEATEEVGGVSSSGFGSAKKVTKQLTLPPSLKRTDAGKGAAMMKRFGAFNRPE